MRYIDYSLNEADLGETPQPDSKAQLGTVAELQFLRFRRPHDPHVPVVHCGHSSSSALNLHVRQQCQRPLHNSIFYVVVMQRSLC